MGMRRPQLSHNRRRIWRAFELPRESAVHTHGGSAGGPNSKYLDGIDLDSPCPSENEYMRRFSTANYAHRLRAGLAR